MPEISIIVPVYKAEKYLQPCVEGILSQTFHNFELILIDDGSPDNSGTICDEFAKRDSRVSVVHQLNKGASSARNVGLSRAEGKYITFCDSDDVVSPMWIERLYRYVTTDESVLPIGVYCSDVSDLGTQINLNITNNVYYSRSEYFLFMESGIAGYMCNALYRRDIIWQQNLHFREDRSRGDFNEDLLFALEYVKHIDHIIYTGFADYCYQSRSNSLSTSFQEYYFEKYKEKYDLWKKNIKESSSSDINERISRLATMMLPHFITALSQEKYNRVRNIVLDPTVQDCLRYAETSKENQHIIRFMKNKQCLMLWLFYILYSLKGRIIT